jgi:hypothetical protein
MRRIAVLVSCLLLSACSAAPGPQPVNQSVAPKTPAPAGGGGGPHAAPGTADASKDAPTAPLDDKVTQLQAAYEKSPNDAALKKQLADATFQNAQFYMYNSPLPPGQKYPKALALYRQTVKLDPSNELARESIDTIEGIYRSMNRPIPES